jgi:hypothetical protein
MNTLITLRKLKQLFQSIKYERDKERKQKYSKSFASIAYCIVTNKGKVTYRQYIRDLANLTVIGHTLSDKIITFFQK